MNDHTCKDISPEKAVALREYFLVRHLRTSVNRTDDGWELVVERSTAGDEEANHLGISGFRRAISFPIYACPFCAEPLEAPAVAQ